MACLVLAAVLGKVEAQSLPKEQLLWGKRLEDNPVVYAGGEQVRQANVRDGSPSGKNRVFSHVAVPTYTIHRAPDAVATGVGVVICPGGGYVDVWLDREGHDLGLWLAERGVTALVLKYRTNSRGGDEKRQYDWETYLPVVVADARESIALLRRGAEELRLDPERIGIVGFSAGGHLAFSAGFGLSDENVPITDTGNPNFVGLFYPWLWEGFEDVVRARGISPPTFIMNGGPDQVTPASKAVDLFKILLEKKVAGELHIFGKGNHGFDLGDERGVSVPLWKVSFVAWLQDLGFFDAPN